MKHEFKPGDLALIVGANTDTTNIGKVCELVELIQPHGKSIFIMPNGRPARHDQDEPSWLLAGATLTQKNPEHSGFAIRQECYLMPLRGDEDPDATLATERPSELVVA